MLPWIIALPIILIVDIIVGVWMFESKCEAPGFVQLMVLVLIPGIYLVLAFLTFKSQD
jgi:hypothetical protein